MVGAGVSRERAADAAVVHGVVLAAGSGERFGGPKQFAELAGERLVDRAVRLLAGTCESIVVAVPAGHGWTGDRTVVVVVGGATRVGSVANAVAALPPSRSADDVVVIHDAIRPLATTDQLDAVIAAVDAGADGAIVASSLPDTLKHVEPDGTVRHVGREGYVLAQGPFAYRRDRLEQVIEQLGTDLVEESIGIERLGGRVVAVAGDRWSHHLVDADDLARFERLLGQ
jgi:2-C-methyl-D-erythritol 4-phosphate cytidylyltransferase